MDWVSILTTCNRAVHSTSRSDNWCSDVTVHQLDRLRWHWQQLKTNKSQIWLTTFNVHAIRQAPVLNCTAGASFHESLWHIYNVQLTLHHQQTLHVLCTVCHKENMKRLRKQLLYIMSLLLTNKLHLCNQQSGDHCFQNYLSVVH